MDSRKNVWQEPLPYSELPEDLRKILADRSNNKKGNSALNILEEKHMMSMIVYIDEMSPVLKGDIYNNISRSTNMASKIDELASIGLVQIYRTVNVSSNVIVITEKGRKVAALIRDMVDAIEPSGGGSDLVYPNPRKSS